jgi:hypothetical protein
VAGFPWLEKPDAKGLERAEMLLADLGAVAKFSIFDSRFSIGRYRAGSRLERQLHPSFRATRQSAFRAKRQA